MDNHLQIYEHRPDLTIKSQAEHYVLCKRGRGPSHVDAFREGAKFLAQLILSGKFSLDELKTL